MKKLSYLILLLFPLSIFCQSGNDEAIATFKQITKTYFAKDCRTINKYIGDTIVIVNKSTNNISQGKDYQIGAKQPCPDRSEILKKIKTHQAYLTDYNIEAIGYDEIKADKISAINAKHAIKSSVASSAISNMKIYNKNLRAGDVLVIGDFPKFNAPYLGGKFVYLLRKNAKGWKIVGIVE